MPALESQIAKIQLGNPKEATSYVLTEAEKASGSEAELYLVAELPLLNPAAAEACEQICVSIASALKRAYRQPTHPGSFENAISQINDELGKLASLGQIHWINKLNGIVAVKDGNDFHIASCGKIAAYLFRGGEFTDISCSPSTSHPLKTFENYASGKIKLGDILILSTTQLFNYIAIDRVKSILTENDFLPASQIMVKLLKDNAGPDAAFGSILNLQIEPGQAPSEEVDLEEFLVDTQEQRPTLASKIFAWLKHFANLSSPKRVPQIGLPKFGENAASNFKNKARAFASGSRGLWNALGRGIAAGGRGLKAQNFKNLSKEKKFFIASVVVLLLAVFLTLTVAVRLKNKNLRIAAVSSQLKQAQTLLKNAQTSLLYNDESGARDYLNQAQNKIPAKEKVSSENQNLYQSVAGQFDELQKKILKQSEAQVTNLGVLAGANFLIKSPDFIAVQSGANIISFNKATGKTEDGVLALADAIKAQAFIAGTKSAVYNGSALKIWDSQNGSLSGQFSNNLPAEKDFGGMAFYPTASKIYTVNKQTGQITSFVVASGTFSRPIVSVKDSDLSRAQDIAIDGAIYALLDNGINKYQSGKKTDFKMPNLPKAFSGKGKIYTEKGFQNIYVLDSGNNRILVLNQKGGLVLTLTSSEFTKMIDFQVDEKNKVIYLLNDSSLLKIVLP